MPHFVSWNQLPDSCVSLIPVFLFLTSSRTRLIVFFQSIHLSRHPSLRHSFTAGLTPTCFTNLFHRRLSSCQRRTGTRIASMLVVFFAFLLFCRELHAHQTHCSTSTTKLTSKDRGRKVEAQIITRITALRNIERRIKGTHNSQSPLHRCRS